MASRSDCRSSWYPPSDWGTRYEPAHRLVRWREHGHTSCREQLTGSQPTEQEDQAWLDDAYQKWAPFQDWYPPDGWGTKYAPAQRLAHWRTHGTASRHNATVTRRPTAEMDTRWLEQADAEWAAKLTAEQTQEEKELQAASFAEGQESREREVLAPYRDEIEAAAREIARQAVSPPPCDGPPCCCHPTKRACQTVAR